MICGALSVLAGSLATMTATYGTGTYAAGTYSTPSPTGDRYPILTTPPYPILTTPPHPILT